MSVRFNTVDVDGLKVFYREAGDQPVPRCCCFTASRVRAICSEI